MYSNRVEIEMLFLLAKASHEPESICENALLSKTMGRNSNAVPHGHSLRVAE